MPDLEWIRALKSVPFDYVIDIYPEKIVVAGRDGSTVMLSTINDLNRWLGSVREKRIRINAHTEVAEDLRLTQNEYLIFGRRFRGDILLMERNITIVSFAQLGYSFITPEEEEVETFVTNYDEDTDTYFDVSGLRLYSTYANVYIEGSEETLLTDVVIRVTFAHTVSIRNMEGDVYVRSSFGVIANVRLRNAHIEVLKNLTIGNVYGADGEGVWYIASYNQTFTFGDIDTTNVYEACLILYSQQGITVDPGGTGYIPLPPPPTSSFIEILIESYGAEKTKFEGRVIRTLDPTGITCKVDIQNWQIVVTNNTDATQLISVTWVVRAYG
jgi:hypothetical protein